MGDIVPHPQLACSDTFLGEAVCSAASVRGTRVLSAAGVSSNDRAGSSAGFRRAARERERRRDVAASHHNLVSELGGGCRWSRTRDEESGFWKHRTLDLLSGLQ